MTTNNDKTEKTEKTGATYAIPMNPEHYELVKAAAKVRGLNAASFGRALILAAAAEVMGVEVPTVVQGKRGPKGGSKHPLAQKYNLTAVEFNKRLVFYVQAHALSGSKKKFDMDKVDFSVDPFVKVEVVEVVDESVMETSAPLEVQPT